jgi:hypothetical protein
MSGGKWGTAFDILRDVMHPSIMYVNSHELAVLFFIYCRTRIYNKEWEAIPLRHFLHGIVGSDGQMVIGPLDISEPTLWQCLKHLEGKRLIEIRKHPLRASEYRIRPDDEVDHTFIMEYMQRHQRKQLTRMLTRFGKNGVIQRVIQAQGTPKSSGEVPQNLGVGVPQNLQALNIPKEKEPISNTAPGAPALKSRSLRLGVK